MAYQLDKTDMSEVTAADTTGLSGVVTIGTVGSHIYIDHPDGDLNKLVMKDISTVDDENKVYIINRGGGPGDGRNPVATTPLGWKKVRVLKRDGNYLLQYADIDASGFEEVTISKTANVNFNYISLTTGSSSTVEPESAKWDLVFSISSNITSFGSGLGAYGFSDFVKTNKVGGVKVAKITLETDEEGNILEGQTEYDDFSASDLADLTFSDAANTIGSSWRSVFTGHFKNIYYVVEDSEGNQYKLQFLGLLNELGERGNSSFKYELL